MTPPRDPFLRAIWQVRSKTDLTPLQQMALLTLWRYLGDKERQIGAVLLAELLGVPVGTAKNIFSQLQRAGYLASDGKFSRRFHKRATRRLTNKLRLPRLGSKKSSADDRSAGRKKSSRRDTKRSSASDIDLGVGQAGRLTPLTGDAPEEKNNNTHDSRGLIADPQGDGRAMVNLGEVMASAPPAKGKAVGQP